MVKKSTLYSALFVAFIDFFGVGLVYPLFSSMLFDASYPLLDSQTTPFMRGVWLALLITLMPLTQFFAAPLWGALSDKSGRKKPLQLSLAIALVGYLVGLVAIWAHNLLLLLASRLLIGSASGNTSIVQAAIADVSCGEDKTKNFGLYTMALGCGFALGPFLGGLFSVHSFTLPFLFAASLVFLNLFFVLYCFEETLLLRSERKVEWNMAITQLWESFKFPALRNILLASFLYNFGWSYFFEFAPVYLIEHFHFSSVELGLFYGVAGGFYALSTGLLIRPFVRLWQPQTLFFGGILGAALTIFALPLVPSPLWLWPLIFCLCFFVSFATPTSITLISERAGSQMQGQALGNLNAINSIAFVLSPLLSGSLVGISSALPMWLGGSVMVAASTLLLITFRSYLLRRQ